MTIKEKRFLFSVCIAKLIIYIFEQGDQGAIDEVKRTQEQANYYHFLGLGSQTSKHLNACAADINLYKKGKYTKNTKDYLKYGEYWEKLHTKCIWGGNWDKDDKPFEKGEFDARHFEVR